MCASRNSNFHLNWKTNFVITKKKALPIRKIWLQLLESNFVLIYKSFDSGLGWGVGHELKKNKYCKNQLKLHINDGLSTSTMEKWKLLGALRGALEIVKKWKCEFSTQHQSKPPNVYPEFHIEINIFLFRFLARLSMFRFKFIDFSWGEKMKKLLVHFFVLTCNIILNSYIKFNLIDLKRIFCNSFSLVLTTLIHFSIVCVCDLVLKMTPFACSSLSSTCSRCTDLLGHHRHSSREAQDIFHWFS